MEISLKRKYGYELTIKADNTTICEDIEERIYSKTADGKADFKIPPKRDISTDILQQFTNVLSDMIYYRKAEFDSSELIEMLFDKLPKEKMNDVLIKLQQLIS